MVVDLDTTLVAVTDPKIIGIRYATANPGHTLLQKVRRTDAVGERSLLIKPISGSQFAIYWIRTLPRMINFRGNLLKS